MKFSRDDLTAQGISVGSHSIYLSGFSYALALSACEVATRRYMWTEMDDSEWDETEAGVSRLMEELFTNMMLGTIVPYVGAVIPEYLLLCDGGTYSREDYPDLYTTLPAELIIDTDTFTLPDMAGITVVGATLARPLLTTFGEETHTLIEAELASHAHIYNPPVLNVDIEAPGVPDPVGAGIGFPTYTDPTGGDQPHNNMQPSISLYWCVVAR